MDSSTLGQSIIDNGLLTAVTAWLKPLPDKSLPALGIQKAFFEVLPKVRYRLPPQLIIRWTSILLH